MLKKLFSGISRQPKAEEAPDITGLDPVCPPVPYFAHLDVSPDGSLVCFVAHDKQGKDSIVSYESGTDQMVWSVPIGSMEECLCKFVSPQRLLILSKWQNDQTLIQLVDISTGSVVNQAVGPRFGYFDSVADISTGLFVGEYSSTLLMINTADDQLRLSQYKHSSVIYKGPMLGPDGLIYFTGPGLMRLEDNRKVDIWDNYYYHSNCFYFDPKGKVYGGGGYNDRSAPSFINVADLKSMDKYQIPYGKEPINNLLPAGPGLLLLSTRKDSVLAKQYPYASITLFSIDKKKKVWGFEIPFMPPDREPLLLSVPDEGWALIRYDIPIRLISLRDGKPVYYLSDKVEELVSLDVMIARAAKEWIEARWLPSKRLIYLTRQPSVREPGRLHCYRVGHIPS